MNDSEVFELMSVQCSVEGLITPAWQVLEGTDLHRFLDGTQPIVRSAERWHPRQEDAVAKVAETMELLHVIEYLPWVILVQWFGDFHCFEHLGIELISNMQQ